MSELARALAQNAKNYVASRPQPLPQEQGLGDAAPPLNPFSSLARALLGYTVENPGKAAEFGLSMAPGSGEAMSARDAWDASGRGAEALGKGEWGNAASEYGNLATALLGAIPGAGVVARGTKRGAAWMDQNLPSGVNKLLDSMAPKASQDTLYAIPAWHGSPHDYPAERLVRKPDGTQDYLVGSPDRLPDVPLGHEVVQDFPLGRVRLDKIGTGEGAQVYGHGWYAAEAPAVARSYADALGDFSDSVKFKEGFVPTAEEQSLLNKLKGHDRQGRRMTLDGLRNELATAARHADGYGMPEIATQRRSELKLIDNLEKNVELQPVGKVYRTELDVEPEQLLDWDKPIGQQSESVKAAIRKLAASHPNEFRRAEINRWLNDDGDFMTGSAMRDTLRGDFGGDAELTQALREAGIPGIRYLDQGSRGAGEGSRNYVIFSDDLVKILGKE